MRIIAEKTVDKINENLFSINGFDNQAVCEMM
jgi:hypothetical protein